MKFQTFEESIQKAGDQLPFDPNLSIADFEKMQNNPISHLCFLALDKFREGEKRLPKVWDLSDATKFVEIGKAIATEKKINDDDLKDDSETIRLLYLFAFQCQGVFNPLCAFLGGLVAQECIKAIT
jgi:ubiquitin-activating enzyme E1